MSFTESRKEHRINGEFTVFLETLSAPPGDSLQTQVVICNTMDVSANGLGVILDTPLTVGSILQLCIEMSETGERFLLIGEVKWCRENTGGNGNYQTGFELYESDGCNIIEWKNMLVEQLTTET